MAAVVHQCRSQSRLVGSGLTSTTNDPGRGRCRVDDRRGSHHQGQVSSLGGLHGSVDVGSVQGFAEEHDARSEVAPAGIARGGRNAQDRFPGGHRQVRLAGKTAINAVETVEPAVQVSEHHRPRPLVEVVDVLGDDVHALQRKPIADQTRPAGQCLVPRVRGGGVHDPDAPQVPGPHQLGIGTPALLGGHRLGGVTGPQPGRLVTEGGNPRLRRHARTGQHQDPAGGACPFQQLGGKRFQFLVVHVPTLAQTPRRMDLMGGNGDCRKEQGRRTGPRPAPG